MEMEIPADLKPMLFDGQLFYGKWGEIFFVSKNRLSYTDMASIPAVSAVNDAVYGRYFLQDIEPAWQRDTIMRELYRYAKPWASDLSGINSQQLMAELLQLFQQDEIRAWQLTDGWVSPPEPIGGNEYRAAGSTSKPGSGPGAASSGSKATKPRGVGVAAAKPATAKTAGHDASSGPNSPERQQNRSTDPIDVTAPLPTTTSDGQDIIYFEKSDIKCKELWDGQAYEFYIDGPDGELEFAEANVDVENSNIEFYINNNFNRGYVLKGNGFSLTDEVLQRSVKKYKENNGMQPEFLNGTIIKKNLANFQTEFSKEKGANSELSDAKVANMAVKKISFGASREKMGYSDINVEIRQYGSAIIDGKIYEHIPTSVKITAKKP
ncbi:hypothetical protein [Arsukibacterium sp.]|uniref:hypothetical protein n=1 Tax=Arsukibacterium sp. TaxID=1977258 RepID=UPI0035668C8F